MTRVLLFDSGKEWGGGTNSLLALCRHLPAYGISLQAAFLSDYRGADRGTIAAELAQYGVPFQLLPQPPHPQMFKLARELARLLGGARRSWREAMLFRVNRRFRINHHADALADLATKLGVNLLYGNNQPASNLELLLAGRKSNIPVVLHVRKTTRLNPVERDMTNATARRVICVSQSVRQHYLNEGLERRLLEVIPNGVETDRPIAHPEWEVPNRAEGEFLLGTASSLIPLKTVEDLLHAHALLLNDGYRCRLIIMGDGPERGRLERLARELGSASRVAFTGFMPDAGAAFGALDVFVLPSSQEGMPRTILEAMLAGCPVVAADVSGSRDLVQPGETGYLYPHGDRAALAGKLRQLLSHPEERLRFGHRGREVVLAQYSMQAYVERVSQAILAVVGKT